MSEPARPEQETRENPVVYSVENGVAKCILESPENRNAITPTMLEALLKCLSRAGSDTSVRSVRLEHSGTTFCAGADLKAVGTSVEAQEALGQSMADLLLAILEHPKPIVAAIHGHVRAGGMGIVASCDCVVAGSNATFGLSEVRVGVAPALVSAVVLPRLRQRDASRWFLTGEIMSATEALAAGFITAVAHEGLNDEVTLLEAAFRQCAPGALSESKRLVNADVRSRLLERREDLIQLSGRLFVSDEAKLGVVAFQAKTAPPWVL